MRAIATGSGIREIDRHTIEDLGVPSLALMETAGRAVAASILEHHRALAEGGVAVLVGSGNNGGDGWVIARTLHRAGITVHVVGESPRTPDAQTMAAAARAMGVPESRELGPVALIVDALLGTGVSNTLREPAAGWVRAVNGHAADVVAVDIPSGLCGDTGQVLGVAIRALRTVTFHQARLGQLLEPAPDHVGVLEVVDIGLQGLERAAVSLDAEDVAALLPRRSGAGHKASLGRLAVMAGSVEMGGAAVLTCLGALLSGCGLVTLHCPEEVLPRLGALPPEVMWTASPPEKTSAIAVGPGIGERSVAAFWMSHPAPAVWDADALRQISGPSPHPRALTPHPGEAARMLGWTPAEVQADRLGALRALSAIAPSLLKGRYTLISGTPTRVNRTGGPMLATGGSGDVLTGVIGALLARGLAPEDALAAGAWIHGRAGELAGAGPLRASQIAQALPSVLRALDRA